MSFERLPLTAQQLALLRWIGDGCPEGVWPDHSHKAFMRVLETRALASTRRWYGKWGAVLLPAGRYYLEHGIYPDEESPRSGETAASVRSVPESVATAKTQSAGRVSPVPRRPKSNAARVNLSRQLVNDIVAAGGTLRIAQDIYDQKARQSLQSRIRFAYGKGYVPAGKEIAERRIDRDFVEVSIVDLPAWRTEVLPTIAVPGRLVNLHPAVEVVRQGDAVLPIKPAVLRNRALLLLQAIAQAAAERSWKVAAPGRPDRRWSRRSDNGQGQLRVTVQGHELDLSIVPMDERVEHKPSAQEREYNEKYGTYIRKWDMVPSRDRLKLELPGRFVHRTTSWSDRDGRRLESCLPEVLQEMGLRAAEADRARIRQEEARRAAEAEQAAQVARATVRFVEAHRMKVLFEQVSAWRHARELERYLTAMRAHIETLADWGERQAAEEWLAWAEDYGSKLDPLSKKLGMPPDPKPRYGDLDPFLEKPRVRHF